MGGSNPMPAPRGAANGDDVEWEVRPGGMLVQRREDGAGPAGPMIGIKVTHGTYQHDLTVPAQSTFGELKKVLALETGLEPHEQRLLFRGKEKENDDCLHMTGVKDMSKILLMEDPASKERKAQEMKQNQGISKAWEKENDDCLHTTGVKDMSKILLMEDPASKEHKAQEMKQNQGISKACESVLCVRVEVDKLAEKVSAFESMVHKGNKIAEKEFVVLTELLMRQILQLDCIEAEGEAKIQRRIEVRRVQNLVDTLDTLKAWNANPFGDSSKAVSVSTQWETFDNGVGSLAAPPPRASTSSTQTTQDWEQFD